ncbi:S41 family peptidase [Leptolyngbya sp. FACHB-261]|uniref:S41 family peptidase n=1 Tax=Leptolyngbya sp. FACHB-261 TaxID=2692806 RepID=UPI0016843736|nr:S41 family peptidase [Leptolyngbya sp. FACHB-261]MBD2100705.1 PDZ domain-containing protein [Leptolyngbya sp. FACHB-261]
MHNWLSVTGWLKRWLWGIVLLLLIQGFWSLPVAARVTLNEDQQLLNEVWRIVNRTYVDASFNGQNWSSLRQKALRGGLKDRKATYSAIESMLEPLGDPFTRFLRPEQYLSLRTSTRGELTGVGLQIALEPETGALTVISPIEGSPADRAELRPLDKILAIDGVPTTDMALDEAAERMRGTIGSQVRLTVGREGQSSFEVLLVRDRIELNPVHAELRQVPDQSAIGYIRLSQFNGNAVSEMAQAVQTLKSQGATRYILDLRGNPGGLLQAGVEIARLWLDQGAIVYTVNREGVQDSLEARGSALAQEPLVVLVNGGTASASEILAAALQDNGRAKLVGTQTFGKGLIQSLFDLSDGSGLAVTVAKYQTPSHHDINKLGITPDVVVEAPSLKRDQIATAQDPQYQAAINLLSNATLAVSG